MAYPSVNAQTLSQVIAESPAAQEQAWVKSVILGANQTNPFYDNMVGAMGSKKPFVERTDLEKIAGDTVHFPVTAPLGGAGLQGEGDRIGREEKFRNYNFDCKIGRWWHGVGMTSIAMEQTIIGSQFDRQANTALRARLGLKKSDDMQMEMIINAAPRNTVRPNNKTTREQLRSTDVIGTETFGSVNTVLSTIGALPMSIAKSAAGADIEKFLFFSHQHGLKQVKVSSTYLDAVTQGFTRGDGNPVFAGGFTDWAGLGIYEWNIKDHAGYGPIGSPMVPRAVLGEAITASNTAPTVKGGGNAEGASRTTADYFQNFSNAPYVGCEGTKRNADTTTTRYIAIYNVSGDDTGKIGFYSYLVNNGNAIVTSERLRAAANTNANTTVGNVTWNTSPWLVAGGTGFQGLTDAHPVGSLIVETNSYGVPFGFSFGLGEMALMVAHGSIQGKKAVGKRTEEHRNHDQDHGIGLETVWGSKVVYRADGLPQGYVLIEHAINYPGFPSVT